jgi:excisionase family DNA binding protein
MRSSKTRARKTKRIHHVAKSPETAREKNKAIPSRCLKPREAAREAGIGETNFYRMLQRGEVPCIRVGNRFVIPRVAFDRWLAECGQRSALAG